MGASGSAWIKPKRRDGLRPEDSKSVPHPRFVRPGQRYFPLDPSNTRKASVRIIRVLESGDRCEARREDADGVVVQLTSHRLLATGQDGHGLHYRFVGYASRSSYTTHAVVVERRGAWLRLICPEWNPAVLITVASGSVPATLHEPGTWLACKGDLGASTAARVGLRQFHSAGRDFDRTRYAEPLPGGDGDRGRAPAASAGEQCGDIVLFVGDPATCDHDRPAEVYVSGHPPPVSAGARVYLHFDGQVRRCRTLRRKRLTPNGTVLVLDGPSDRVAAPVAVQRPVAAVAGGCHGQQSWTWRSWHPADERRR